MGYSERGVINSLFCEIKQKNNHLQLITELLSLTKPKKIDFKIKDAKILIEQSFNDFGNPDVVLLIDNSDKKLSIFIEAKVKTFGKKWNINESDLFDQLRLKLLLAKGLREKGDKLLNENILYKSRIKKIGENEVVQKAVKKLLPYSDETLFVAITPNDDKESLEKFFTNLDYEDSYLNWGHISWKEIEEFCNEKELKATSNVFEFNEGQIY